MHRAEWLREVSREIDWVTEWLRKVPKQKDLLGSRVAERSKQRDRLGSRLDERSKLRDRLGSCVAGRSSRVGWMVWLRMKSAGGSKVREISRLDSCVAKKEVDS